MRCDACDHWLVKRITTYDDGGIVTNFQAPDGLGRCDLGLSLKDGFTPADFGCAKFLESGYDHVDKKHKPGSPWQHWEVKACPDCKIAGNDEIGRGFGCVRCAGTGKVRYYDDGFVGEEQTRLHPKQKERLAAGPPKCIGCGRDVNPDWIHCAYCGARTNKPSEREVIGYEVGAIQGTTDDMILAAKAKREAQVAVRQDQVFAPPESPQGC